jgi:hypothetical protein
MAINFGEHTLPGLPKSTAVAAVPPDPGRAGPPPHQAGFRSSPAHESPNLGVQLLRRGTKRDERLPKTKPENRHELCQMHESPRTGEKRHAEELSFVRMVERRSSARTRSL